MEDAGYSDSEPMTVEVFKGSAASTETAWVGGRNIPTDLRGYVPKNNDPLIIDGKDRTIVGIQNAAASWIIQTIKAN